MSFSSLHSFWSFGYKILGYRLFSFRILLLHCLLPFTVIVEQSEVILIPDSSCDFFVSSLPHTLFLEMGRFSPSP